MRKILILVALMSSVAFGAESPGAHSNNNNYANDRAEIENLQARYLFALDFNDGETYASVFAPDGVLDWAGGITKGRDNIVKETQKMKDTFAKGGKYIANPHLRHFITNNVIEIKGDRAYGRAYWLELFNDVPEGAEPVVRAYGHSEDEYQKVDGRWLWARRKIFNEMMSSRLAPEKNPASALGR